MVLPDKGSEAPEEIFVYVAHWDHLGTDPDLEGDQIYNGALDNASGVAALLEIARAYTKLPQAPRRSVLFLSVTAEEQGLLGTGARCKWRPGIRKRLLLPLGSLRTGQERRANDVSLGRLR